jgi:hypothetical protein
MEFRNKTEFSDLRIAEKPRKSRDLRRHGKAWLMASSLLKPGQELIYSRFGGRVKNGILKESTPDGSADSE